MLTYLPSHPLPGVLGLDVHIPEVAHYVSPSAQVTYDAAPAA